MIWNILLFLFCICNSTEPITQANNLPNVLAQQYVFDSGESIPETPEWLSITPYLITVPTPDVSKEEENVSATFSLLISYDFTKHNANFTITLQSNEGETTKKAPIDIISLSFSEKQTEKCKCPFDITKGILAPNITINEELMEKVKTIDKNYHELMDNIEKNSILEEPNLTKKLSKNGNERLEGLKVKNAYNLANICKNSMLDLVVFIKNLKKRLPIYEFIVEKPPDGKKYSKFEEMMLEPLSKKLAEITSRIEVYTNQGWKVNKGEGVNIVLNTKKQEDIQTQTKKKNDLQLNGNKFVEINNFINDNGKNDKLSKNDIKKVLDDIQKLSDNKITYEDKTNSSKKQGSHQGYFEVKKKGIDKEEILQVSYVANHGKKGSSKNVAPTTVKHLEAVIDKFDVKQMLVAEKTKNEEQVEEKKKLTAEINELNFQYKKEGKIFVFHLRQKKYLEAYIQSIKHAFDVMRNANDKAFNPLEILQRHYDQTVENIKKSLAIVLPIYDKLDKKIKSSK